MVIIQKYYYQKIESESMEAQESLNVRCSDGLTGIMCLKKQKEVS